MTIKLLQIKDQLVQQLKEKFKNGLQYHQDSQNREFEIISLTIDSLNLEELLPCTDTFPRAYFRSKDIFVEALGLGSAFSLQNPEHRSYIDQLKTQNPRLVFFASEQFDEAPQNAREWSAFSPCHYLLPRITFLKSSSTKNQMELRMAFKTDIINCQDKQKKLLSEIEDILNPRPSKKQLPGLKEIAQIPNRSLWEEAVQHITHDIKEAQYEKAVLCRKIKVTYEKNYPCSHLLSLLSEKAQTSYLFYFEPQDGHAFISMTPERLYWRCANELIVDCLAGTTSRGITPQKDHELGQALLTDPKEKEEHNIVKKQIQSALSKICLQYSIPKETELLKLPYIQHLYTKVKGQLNPQISFWKILKALHPTPAVGGRPWTAARQAINEYEPFERGLYAAPFGLLWDQEEEFAVGIRSALATENELHLFGGAGIVGASEPIQEWLETGNKMKNFLLPLLPNRNDQGNLEI